MLYDAVRALVSHKAEFFCEVRGKGMMTKSGNQVGKPERHWRELVAGKFERLKLRVRREGAVREA